MRRFTLIIFSSLLLNSCAPPRVTPEKLHAHYQAHAMEKLNHMSYMGTKGNDHYFHHFRISMMKKEFRVPKDELLIDNEFPLTDDQEKWRPYMVLEVNIDGSKHITLMDHRDMAIHFDNAPIIEGFVPAEP